MRYFLYTFFVLYQPKIKLNGNVLSWIFNVYRDPIKKRHKIPRNANILITAMGWKFLKRICLHSWHSLQITRYCNNQTNQTLKHFLLATCCKDAQLVHILKLNWQRGTTEQAKNSVFALTMCFPKNYCPKTCLPLKKKKNETKSVESLRLSKNQTQIYKLV